MSRTAKAAKSARADFCQDKLFKLADALVKDAKDTKVGPVLVPLAMQGLFRAIANSLSGPQSTAHVTRLANRLDPLLAVLERSGIQDSDKFVHQIEDQLLLLRDLIV